MTSLIPSTYLDRLRLEGVWYLVEQYLWQGLVKEGKKWWQSRKELHWCNIHATIEKQDQHQKLISVLKWNRLFRFLPFERRKQ
jgi:hypothetical protein